MSNRKLFNSLSRERKRKRLLKLYEKSVGHSAVAVERDVSNDPNPGSQLQPLLCNSATGSSFNSEPSESNQVFELLDQYPLSYGSDSDDCFDSKFQMEELKSELANWSVQFSITNVALTALLCILRSHDCFKSLPSDARTILKTPRCIQVKNVSPGQYCHIGISNQLKKMFASAQHIFSSLQHSDLMIGIDGLPLFHSNSGELWPILGSVLNIPSLSSTVFPIGIYFGLKKHSSCFEFLNDFVEEIVGLIRNGLICNGKNVAVRIKGICCDAPAKAFILGIKGHNGYFSCTRCKQEGSFFDNRMTFPIFDSLPRTHEGFINKEDTEFNTGDTPLTTIPSLHMVSSFPLDYMHLVCLGVMRTMIYVWMFGPAPLKLPSRIIDSISSNLLSLKASIPVEFCRKPRGLDEVKRWKATEFRQFLLYTGPLVLYDILLPEQKEIYNNFLSLHIAMTLLLSKKFCYQHQEYAKGLLHFVQTFQSLYGQKYITHNFHGLIHIADDISVFGPLDGCSAFKFENFLFSLKKCVRKGNKPFQQVVKHLAEISNSTISPVSDNEVNKLYPIFECQHYSGPVFDGCNPDQQYNTAKFQNFKITTSTPNSCCMMNDGSIVIVENFIYSNSLCTMVILCKQFMTVCDFFGLPFCKSSDVNITVVRNMSDVHIRPVSDIKEKLVLLTLGSKNVTLPLLHT
ncbi:uncharacterized protein LOC126234822 [Schistocerca nitens]|uniref:uncharacterized protein LOC126234822 n=1 Tax=Schistocerca nitens TaxID=7011 RepID=UPI002117300E|nr:uncharacterized protein LOC126234822 [Schistocerca nitens]